jgi:predicted transcriptional regulator of viral defense system
MATSPPRQQGPIADLVDRLQASGRYTFTRTEVERETQLSESSLEAALRRLRARRRIATPRRGFHVIVPLEHQSAGAPPPPWFIDDLMRFLGQRYYVGLLTAAALHGAGHQQPMVFQVVTDRPTRPARVGRARIAFHVTRNLESVPVVALTTETGTMRASTPEATAFDLVRFVAAAGHTNNVATVLSELAERLSADELARLAPHHLLPDVQRLGFLLEFVGEGVKAVRLQSWLGEQRVRPVVLARGRPKGSVKPVGAWRVIPNVDVEIDR